MKGEISLIKIETREGGLYACSVSRGGEAREVGRARSVSLEAHCEWSWELFYILPKRL